MEIEITSEQYNLIQDEIIRLETYLSWISNKDDPWERIHIIDTIEDLKEIVRTEKITLY